MVHKRDTGPFFVCYLYWRSDSSLLASEVPRAVETSSCAKCVDPPSNLHLVHWVIWSTILLFGWVQSQLKPLFVQFNLTHFKLKTPRVPLALTWVDCPGAGRLEEGSGEKCASHLLIFSRFVHLFPAFFLHLALHFLGEFSGTCSAISSTKATNSFYFGEFQVAKYHLHWISMQQCFFTGYLFLNSFIWPPGPQNGGMHSSYPRFLQSSTFSSHFWHIFCIFALSFRGWPTHSSRGPPRSTRSCWSRPKRAAAHGALLSSDPLADRLPARLHAWLTGWLYSLEDLIHKGEASIAHRILFSGFSPNEAHILTEKLSVVAVLHAPERWKKYYSFAEWTRAGKSPAVFADWLWASVLKLWMPSPFRLTHECSRATTNTNTSTRAQPFQCRSWQNGHQARTGWNIHNENEEHRRSRLRAKRGLHVWTSARAACIQTCRSPR